MKLTGVLLIILGVLALAYQGITYTKKEQELKVGSLEVTTEEKKTIPLPPIVGVAALAGGVALLFADSRRKRA
jgi:uncharacterized membrane protein HdeD (DUF308 family)